MGADKTTVDVESKTARPVVLLGRDAILGADDLRSKVVPVPEWGGSVRVRAMNGGERDEFQMSVLKPDGMTLDRKQYRTKLVAACVVDEEGKRLFSNEDVARLELKSSVALDRVWMAADELNAMTEAKVEEAVKN